MKMTITKGTEDHLIHHHYYKAKAHLKKYLPAEYKRLQKTGELETHLRSIEEQADDTMYKACLSGMNYIETQELLRDILYPDPRTIGS